MSKLGQGVRSLGTLTLPVDGQPYGGSPVEEVAAAAVAGIQLVHLDRLYGPSNDFKVLVSLRGTGQDDIST